MHFTAFVKGNASYIIDSCILTISLTVVSFDLSKSFTLSVPGLTIRAYLHGGGGPQVGEVTCLAVV